jgi:alkanesulfonate monooxygenase SsuD/methylene tetrahydromethanopterin reductase-like flavin-dependent oxidoreductase (luciferase family)/predicted kinase
VRLASDSLVVLIGPAGAGKSAWAAQQFRSEQVVSSDALRAVVGVSEHDQRAGSDAFEILDLIVDRRLSRRLLTVVDTLGLDPERRADYVALARRHRVPCYAVLFDTPADVCRARNRARARPVPARVLAAQLTARDQAATPGQLASEGFDGVHGPEPVEVVPPDMVAAPDAAEAQRRARTGLRFGLQLSSFGGMTASDGRGGASFAGRLAETVTVAEAAGFTSLWVMDHMVQIPQLGRPWEDLPESWTTLAWCAARTTTMRLGTLVSGVTLRNPAHLAKIVATLDVLSSGRAICGIGLAWWKWEHEVFGWPFPVVAERYALLEDALGLLPVMWGPGSPAYKGSRLEVTETLCYPRPLQEHVPILVGGSGEKRTLALAARYADACNLFGDAGTVAHKRGVLAEHCARYGRDPAEVRVTHLSTAVAARSRRELAAIVERLGSATSTPEQAAARLGAGTVDDQIGRYRQLADAGVQTAIVSLPDAGTPGALETFGQVIAAFEPEPSAASW